MFSPCLNFPFYLKNIFFKLVHLDWDPKKLQILPLMNCLLSLWVYNRPHSTPFFKLDYIICCTGILMFWIWLIASSCCHLIYSSLLYISCKLVMRFRGTIIFRFNIFLLKFLQGVFIRVTMCFASYQAI